MIACAGSLQYSIVRSAISIAIMSFLILATTGELIAFQAAPASPPAVDPKTRQLEAIVSLSHQRIVNSEWDLAIQESDKALAIDATFAAAQVTRGMAFNGKGEYDNAIREFDLVTAIVGREPVLLTNRADAYAHRSESLYHKGEFLSAIDSAYFALLEKGDHVLAHNNRSLAYVARQEYDKAIQSADRAINADPKSAEAYSLRGYAYGAKGNADQALADENKAIELNPQLAEAFQRRAAAYAAKGDAANAAKDLEKALSLKPDMPDALCDRAYLYGLQRDLPKAMADLDRAILVKPQFAKAHFRKGLALLDQDKFDQAIASFSEAIRLQPKHGAAHCYRGYAHIGNAGFELARDDFSKAIELEPTLAAAWSGRSQALKKLGLTRDASADLAKFRELAPAAASKKADKDKKDKSEEPEGFLVKSKPVAPGNRMQMLRSAKEIDRLVQANYTKHSVQPNPRTSDPQFLRRITLDITGTIPGYQETRKFLGTTDADKRSVLIDELLSSEGYASHNFNYWAMLLWDRIIMIMKFHDPACDCDHCEKIRGNRVPATPA